jgi:DNA-3-methyladenine glycosylase I
VGFDREAWVRLFKVNFKFTGGEITNEFLLSSGYLEGAHIVTCPVYEKIMARRPAWAQRGVE